MPPAYRVWQTLDVAAPAFVLATLLITIVDPQCVVAVKGDEMTRRFACPS
jgi:hypothetical protein